MKFKWLVFCKKFSLNTDKTKHAFFHKQKQREKVQLPLTDLIIDKV